jgi:hypothetical protein
VAVDDRNGIRVCNRDLVRRDSNQFAVLCMCLMNSQVSATQTALPQIPEVGELGQERSRNILYRPIPHIRENEEQQRQRQQRPRGEEQRQEHGRQLNPEREGADLLLLRGSEVKRGEVLASKQARGSNSHTRRSNVYNTIRARSSASTN